MAHSSPPPQWQKGDLWDTDPNTFLAREAVKRKDLTEAYLADDAIMKLLVNKREKTIKGTVIFRFNEAEFAKGAVLRSKHKGRGAPALAPDGTVMTVAAGQRANFNIVLNGGNRNLPVGNWSVENYQAMSDHPGYNAWLAGIKRTTGDALRAGIPLTSINATLTGPPRGWQQKPSEPAERANDLRDKSGSPELVDPKLIDPRLIDPNLTNLANKGQPNLTNDFTNPAINKAQERTTTSHPVTPQQTTPKDVPSEYATLPSNHSEITTSPGSSLSGADRSETAGLELAIFEPVASNSAVSEPAPSAPASSKSTTPEPVASKSTTPEAIIPKLVSSLAASAPTSPPLTTSEPVTPELAAFEPSTPVTVSTPGNSETAASEPSNPGHIISKPEISNLAASESVTSEPTVSVPATPDPGVFQPVAPEPKAPKPISSEPIVSESATSESPTAEPSTSEPVAPTNAEAAASQPIALESEASQIGASKPVATEPTPSDTAAPDLAPSQLGLMPIVADTVPEPASLESFSSFRIEATKNPLEDTKPHITQIPLPIKVRQQRASPGLGLMRSGSEPAVGLGIDTGSMEQTTAKQSMSMSRQQSFRRQSSFEIPESPPPSVHRGVLLGGGMSRERTPTISSEATIFKHNNTTVSTGRLGAQYSPTSQPVTTMSTGRPATHYSPTIQANSTATQASPFQSPPQTPASNGSLKRKATEPLDRLVTFYVTDRNSEDGGTFNFSERKLNENAPDFYEQFKGIGRRAHKVNGPVYDVMEKPKIFEAILHWIDKRRVMRKSYSAPDDLECYYLDLYAAAADKYVLPGLSNAIINKMYDWHSTGTVQFQMIDRVYLMTEPGDGLRRFYFGCMMALSTEQFEDTPMEQAAVMIDLFSVAKSTWKGMEAKEAYHDA